MERVYVGNLPPDIRIKDIDDFFKPFGKLFSIDVNHRANPVYACVQFDNARNAFNAVKSRNGYDYEGYTLQLRLIENEVRKHNDATPPPPPPPSIFNTFGLQNNDGRFADAGGCNNRMGGNFLNSSFQSNANSTWLDNRFGGQQNMIQYPTTNRLNVPHNMMGFSANNSNDQQQNLNNRSNPQSLANMSNFQAQNWNNSSNSQNMDNRSNFQTQSMNNRSNNQPFFQTQNMNNRSNNQLQSMNMVGYSNNNNNNSWDSDNNGMGWNSGNYNNVSYNNDRSNGTKVNRSYVTPEIEECYTRGLSGSGRKWFSRYLQKGLSPEMARIKALEHRTVPYLREDPKINQIPNNPTNQALETIGNTIMSLLSTNPVDQYNNNGGGNIEMPGQISSNTHARMSSQTPRNAVSKLQYEKSLRILKEIRNKSVQSAKDRLSKKYHTQIVNDYEDFIRKSNPVSGSKSKSSLSEDKLSEMLRTKKRQLLTAAWKLEDKKMKRTVGGAHKKRHRILLDNGFSDIEAKTLAIHPLEELKPLISLKRDYDIITKKKDYKTTNKSISKIPSASGYRNDINYMNRYRVERVASLSDNILTALGQCIVRIHKYEKEKNLPLTRNKFVSLILLWNRRRGYIEKETKSTKNETSAKRNREKEKNNTNTNVVGEKPKEGKNTDNQVIDGETQNINEENQDIGEKNQDNDEENQDIDEANKDISEENQDITEEEEQNVNEHEKNGVENTDGNENPGSSNDENRNDDCLDQIQIKVERD